MTSTVQPASSKPRRTPWRNSARKLIREVGRFIAVSLFGVALLGMSPAQAQETVCARVKIEIKQQLTLERQAFDAEMKINNTTTTGVIENVSIVVKMMEENGTPVVITDDPNNLSAKFYVRVSNKQNITDIGGNGTVNPSTTSIINWLIIPAPGAAGTSPFGKKYLVGATLKYRFNGEDQVLEVSPDVITVKPLPLLTLDYFLTQHVEGDDPLTPEIEPSVPFTLGVRVKNTGFATAKGLKIDSAQPKIIENKEGLLIGFKLTGSYLNDAPAENTLLINFGEIAANTSKIGRWIMETTLAGRFTEFTARFSHADELGGTLTSIMQATNAHFLIRDVRVDLPGRDNVRDFLAQDGDIIRVYESDGMDTVVTDRSSGAGMTAGINAAGNASYKLEIPPTAGFIYVKLPDPYNGDKALGQIVRSDAKIMLPENVWLSRTRNETTKKWEYWVNFFDVNTPGVYDAEFKAPPAEAKPPVIQFIPDRTVQETKQVSFLVEASSPNGKPVTLSAAPLPTGAMFNPQPTSTGIANSVFDWTPAKGQAGNYMITYTASDGTLTSTRTASIKVETSSPPPGPTPPLLVSPLGDARVATFTPTLIVQTGTATLDPTAQVQFEVYADSAMTQLIDSGVVNKGVTTGDAGTTSFTLTKTLNEDTRYWWRARSFDGTAMYSAWMNSKFFVNVVNHPPETFNLTSPAPSTEVGSVMPVLTWNNSTDRDEDPITYSVYVYRDSALTDMIASGDKLQAGAEGSTSWTVTVPLQNHVQYYWRAVATDNRGASTQTPARVFTVNTGNTAPTVPLIQSPAVGGQTALSTTTLTIQNSTDAEKDLLTYVFEIDTVNTFDSASKKTSGQVMENLGGTTSWTVSDLVENKRYYWRVKAQDGRAESDWAVGNFLMNATNEAPPAPTVKNPGNAAWVATIEPGLEANEAPDPEGETVRYQFEVYRDAGLTQLIASGTSESTSWVVTPALADKSAYYWRVRALDANNSVSAWSASTVMYVSTGPYVDPTVLVTAPATNQSPVWMGNSRKITIAWEGSDPNLEANVALYYDTKNSGFAGTLIVDGLKQGAGTQSGSYVWDVTNLPVGAYYIYAVIYDPKGVGRAYAPGALVMTPQSQSGSIVMTGASQPLVVTEDGGQTTATVKLGSAPTSDVVVPITSSSTRFGAVDPPQLTFTPLNWSMPQTVTINGSTNCAPDGNKTFQVKAGTANTLDPEYFGIENALSVTVKDNDSAWAAPSTDTKNIHICNYKIVSGGRISPTKWEYNVSAELTNNTPAVNGVTATLKAVPNAIWIIDGGLVFGAAATGDTVKSGDTFTVRASRALTNSDFIKGYQWAVKTK